MPPSILYCGDTSLATAASYLGGVIASTGQEFDYVASDQELPRESLAGRRLYILSDYPASRMSHATQVALVANVAAGAGLLMIGGWESFHGLGGDWDGTPIGDCLPVEIATQDDRRNCDHVILARPAAGAEQHPIIAGLPWGASPPVIGGYNAFEAKPQSETILVAEHYSPQFATADGPATFTPRGQTPLLVVGKYEAGRVAALATDLAPHWVGPLVDWGASQTCPRVTARAPGAEGIEVGAHYARLVWQLLTWTGRLPL